MFIPKARKNKRPTPLVEEPIEEYKTVNVQVETYEIHKGNKSEQKQNSKYDCDEKILFFVNFIF